MSDLETLSARLAAFNDARDWGQYHTPRNLAMALSVEAAELLECFLWTEEASPLQDGGHLAEEAADILICLLNFCRRANIDLATAFEEKLARNAAKYPVEKARGRAEKYDQL